MEPQVTDPASDREYVQGRRWLDPEGGRLAAGARSSTPLPDIDPLFDRRAIARGALAVSLALPVIACGVGVWTIVGTVEWVDGVNTTIVGTWSMVVAGVYAVAVGHGYWLRGRREACRTSNPARAETPIAAKTAVAPVASEPSTDQPAPSTPAPPSVAPPAQTEMPVPWYARSR